MINKSLIKNSLLKISGIDAKKFLQGQLTCNLEEISPQQSRLGAHCNPQGRVISLFTIFLYHDDYYLLMPATIVALAMASLKKYAIFYKVTMEAVSIDQLDNITNNIPLERGMIPAIYPETSGKFLPHELNLHQLNAISFDKGCYTGQEIIARMHYRGKLKKHMYQAKITSSTPPLPGTDVYYQSGYEKQIGGIIVDSTSEMPDNLILLVCEEVNAKNDHLFLDFPDQDHHAYITFIE